METEERTIEILVHSIEVSLARMEGKLFGKDAQGKATEGAPNIIDRICSSLENCKKMADHIDSQLSRI